MYLPSEGLRRFLVQTFGETYPFYSISYLMRLLYHHVFTTQQFDLPGNLSIMVFNDPLAAALEVRACHCSELPFFIRQQLMVIPAGSLVTAVPSTQRVAVSPTFANLVCNGRTSLSYIEVHTYFSVYLNINHPSIFGPANPYIAFLDSTPLGDVLRIKAMHKTQIPHMLRSQLEFLTSMFPILPITSFNSSITSSCASMIDQSPSTAPNVVSEVVTPYILPLFPDLITSDTSPEDFTVDCSLARIGISFNSTTLSHPVNNSSPHRLYTAPVQLGSSFPSSVMATNDFFDARNTNPSFVREFILSLPSPSLSVVTSLEESDTVPYQSEFSVGSNSDTNRPAQAYGKCLLDSSSTVTLECEHPDLDSFKAVEPMESTDNSHVSDLDDNIPLGRFTSLKLCILCKTPTEITYCSNCMDIRKQWVYLKKSPGIKFKSKHVRNLCRWEPDALVETTRHISSSDPICDICMVNQKNSVFIHGKTSHMSCYQCARNIWAISSRCPFCRRWVSNIVKIL